MATKAKKYQDGGMTGFEKRQAKKIAKAKTRAAVAEIEGEGTVSQKRNNRAERASVVLGTKRAKTPKRLSTSTSTTTVDNRNSGNTTNTTNSGSTSAGGAGGSSGSTSGSGVDQSARSSRNTSVRQTQVNNRNRTSNTSVRQSQNNSRTNNTNTDNSTNTSNTKYTDNSKRTSTNNSRRNTQIGTGNTSTKNSNFKKGGAMKKMKTGGMVNANASVKKQIVAGSKGVKSGVNPRAAASKVAKGRVGGTSKAPRAAAPMKRK